MTIGALQQLVVLLGHAKRGFPEDGVIQRHAKGLSKHLRELVDRLEPDCSTQARPESPRLVSASLDSTRRDGHGQNPRAQGQHSHR